MDQVVEKNKFLVIEIDSCLTWRLQIEQVVGKLTKAYYAILVLSRSDDFETLRTLFCGYIFTHLSYGVVFGDTAMTIKEFSDVKRKLY